MIISTLSNPYVLVCLFYLGYLSFKFYKKSTLPPSPLEIIRGPPRVSKLLGNSQLKESFGPGIYYLNLVKEYGPAVLLPSVGRTSSLLLSDPKAIHAVMNDTNAFGSNKLRRQMVLFMTGDSLLGHFGAVHRRQRRTIAPAFTSTHLVELYPIFMKLATRLGDTVEKEIKKGGEKGWSRDGEKDGKSAIVNAYSLFNCAALDVIGEAGFGYKFSALEHGAHHDPVAKSSHELVEAWSGKMGLPFILQMMFANSIYTPACSWPLSSRNIAAHKHNKLMRKVATQIIEGKKKEIREEMGLEKGESNGTTREDFDGKKDIVHLLLRANMAKDLKENERMSDEEVREQIPLLATAGHETSAVTSTWFLHFLAENQEVQDELRQHIITNEHILREDPESEEQQLITNIILETVRMVPPVFETQRTAFKDITIPLFRPIVGKDGKGLYSITVPKGTNIELGLAQSNLDPMLFGEDAEKWNPKRWQNLPAAHREAKLPPWGIFSFAAGPKSCIGSHFAMSEMRAFLIDIIPRFRFQPSGFTIVPKHALVQKPFVKERGEIALPLKATIISRD